MKTKRLSKRQREERSGLILGFVWMSFWAGLGGLAFYFLCLSDKPDPLAALDPRTPATVKMAKKGR